MKTGTREELREWRRKLIERHKQKPITKLFRELDDRARAEREINGKEKKQL
jgi:hypothetical protein